MPARNNTLSGIKPRENESDPVIPVNLRFDAIVGLSFHKIHLNNNTDAYALTVLTTAGQEVAIGAPGSLADAQDAVAQDYNKYLQQ